MRFLKACAILLTISFALPGAAVAAMIGVLRVRGSFFAGAKEAGDIEHGRVVVCVYIEGVGTTEVILLVGHGGRYPWRVDVG